MQTHVFLTDNCSHSQALNLAGCWTVIMEIDWNTHEKGRLIKNPSPADHDKSEEIMADIPDRLLQIKSAQ